MRYEIGYKVTKKNAHLQTFAKKNCTNVHFLIPCGSLGLHKGESRGIKKVEAELHFSSQKLLTKCPALPCCNFGGEVVPVKRGKHRRKGVKGRAEDTKKIPYIKMYMGNSFKFLQFSREMADFEGKSSIR